jgi:uncharacterized protein YbjT (DUF2867 family)
MYTVVGASGQVGSVIVEQLLRKGETVKGIVRNEEKQAALRKKGAQVAIADAFDLPALQAAAEDTNILFVLTPEVAHSKDIIGDTQKILDHYRQVVQHNTGIRKVVALSSVGAEHATGTGNLQMSYMLEHAFTGLPEEQVFIRPVYYFSNWMVYLPVIKEKKVLPSFMPVDFLLPMISPMDVAALAADILVKEEEDTERRIYQLEGPTSYTPADVAAAFSVALQENIQVDEIPREQWRSNLQEAGFTENAIKNFCEMTDAVIAGKAKMLDKGVTRLKGRTTLQEYLS